MFFLKEGIDERQIALSEMTRRFGRENGRRHRIKRLISRYAIPVIALAVTLAWAVFELSKFF